MKNDDLRAKIHTKVDELSDQRLSELWAFLANPQAPSTTKPIPTEPPGGQLYENRSDRAETAPEFIQRVYGEWLDGTFTRVDLRNLDAKAAAGLHNWEKNHRQRAKINLPTKKERTDAILKAPNAVADPFAVARAINAERGRRSRAKAKQP
ncbi:MAG: hypothetical protein DI626_03130 [Micavibrio aeruginosavorus]|uniref:Uncharacterized protein n=1 Tax=Micavibrio aeruginosavorus TaxID=349221 RepID=A0A2W5BXP0_9BACT|nr:MAG: hypothetical protein DI626_03130 [Micavibrio aeruginosavorus]